MGEKKGREDKRDKGGKPFYGKVCPNNREGVKALEFQAIDEGKNAWYTWKWAVGKKTLLGKDIFFVREYAVENVCA
ncbi:MAG TPA: hypothetical protein VHT73_16370 [Thermodesulfobacteriota bacterium]|nr:hypothetical protein [Thermodesulfobacteriota bacterium]